MDPRGAGREGVGGPAPPAGTPGAVSGACRPRVLARTTHVRWPLLWKAIAPAQVHGDSVRWLLSGGRIGAGGCRVRCSIWTSRRQCASGGAGATESGCAGRPRSGPCRAGISKSAALYPGARLSWAMKGTMRDGRGGRLQTMKSALDCLALPDSGGSGLFFRPPAVDGRLFDQGRHFRIEWTDPREPGSSLLGTGGSPLAARLGRTQPGHGLPPRVHLDLVTNSDRRSPRPGTRFPARPGTGRAGGWPTSASQDGARSPGVAVGGRGAESRTGFEPRASDLVAGGLRILVSGPTTRARPAFSA